MAMSTIRIPAPRAPRAAEAGVTTTRGQRVIVMRADGEHRDLRATCDPYVGDDGQEYVRVVAESDWYAWALTGTRPRVEECLATSVFLE